MALIILLLKGNIIASIPRKHILISKSKYFIFILDSITIYSDNRNKIIAYISQVTNVYPSVLVLC